MNQYCSEPNIIEATEPLYVGQSAKIILETGLEDLIDAVALKIRYRKPDETAGAWTATINVDVDTDIEYTTVTADLDLPGYWYFQSYAEYAGGQKKYGTQWVKFKVLTPL
jgi:hypothetical protein